MPDHAIMTARELWAPGAGSVLVAVLLAYAVGFDQGALVGPVTDAFADTGGLLHEVFHDARHLTGLPCH